MKRFNRPPQLRIDTAYINGIAHDLRQPLVILNREIRNLPPNSDLAVAFAAYNALVEELLAAANSKIRDSAYFEDTQLFKLADVFDAAVKTVRPLTAASERPFAIDVEQTHIAVEAPKSAVYRIVVNLLSNAIKHSQGTRAQVRASISPSGGLLIVVSDDGAGISTGLLREIVDSRHKEDERPLSLQSAGGKRVGIRNSLLLAEALGGQITADPDAQGTTWNIELGLEIIRSEPGLLDQAGSNPLRNGVVAILDDDPGVGDAIAQQFRDLGATAHAFDDELSLLQFTQHRHIDLYVIDFMLSRGSSERILHLLRQRKRACDIVLLTAHPTEAAKMPIDPPIQIFAKPLDAAQLESLALLLKARIESATVAPTP
jgi:CheY-like chemotaxis protein